MKSLPLGYKYNLKFIYVFCNSRDDRAGSKVGHIAWQTGAKEEEAQGGRQDKVWIVDYQSVA